jgi:FkbM family methyltransferase
MKKTLRRIIPKIVVDILTEYTKRKIMKRNGGKLLIRPNTTDLVVFRDTFILKYGAIKITPPVKCIIDAGAYAGYMTMYYAHTYPNALIISIEPNPENFAVLTANTEHLENVKRINAALWWKQTDLYLQDRGTGEWGFATHTSQDSDTTEKLTVVTIPQLIKQYNLTSIDILKIDIEGSEKELFESDTSQWLPHVRSISTETHDRFKPGCTDAVKNALPRDKWNYSYRGDKHEFIKKIFV